ncbi:hypothetical protein K3495_g11294 [Podosphaera aphanis]|nr:hypothetical protein K3495_g11294 [Podosphaera aphanis]
MRLPGRSRTPTERQQIQEKDITTSVEMNDSNTQGVKKLEMSLLEEESSVTFEATESTEQAGPPPYGDDATSTLALPVNRLSDSSRSDVSSGEHGVYGTTTTTTHTVQTTTTFFRLPRRRKPTPLFDLTHLPQKPNAHQASHPPAATRTPAGSPRISVTESLPINSSLSPAGENTKERKIISPPHSPIKSSKLSTNCELARHDTQISNRSSSTPSKLGFRRRSSTLNSARDVPTDDLTFPPLIQSTRTSSSIGRKSLGDFFGLSHKTHLSSEALGPRQSSTIRTTGRNTPQSNSLQLNRELPVILPVRHEDEPPSKYLIRLEEAVSRGVVASVLSKGADQFSKAVLRSYMRGFGFFGDPMDMAIRKFLMEVELPKETQQIDRCLQGFANRYHECNPGVYASPDQAYFIAFSLLILHTDVFNKNNKHKMQKADYIKNTHGEGVCDEILECFYDNISYTPFIHVEDDLDINGERIIAHKLKKRHKFSGNSVPVKRPSREPVDPYTLIIDDRLDTLRPNLKDVMYLDDHYSYLGTAACLNLFDLQKTFFKTGILQIVSARSRPDAFMSDRTVKNPNEAQAGIVDIKITKVGLLWRKDTKKKKTRSPWQEWGAILTGAQLYFFRNTAWIKSLMHQLDTHIKQGHDETPVIFKPPLDQFKPDALISTDNSVALIDFKYKKHKNAFIFVRHAGLEETFLADNEEEMNDWLAKLNYAAAFRTSGVRMRSVIGGTYDGQRSRGIRRMEAHIDSVDQLQSPRKDNDAPSCKIDAKMVHDILLARKEIMLQKIADAEEKLCAARKQLDLLLRNARHLQILAPIQPKTRENVLAAAGRIAAQLKWGRIKIWSLQCHRDILTMDLEEGDKISGNFTASNDGVIEMPTSDRVALHRLHSKESLSSPVGSPHPSRVPSADYSLTSVKSSHKREEREVVELLHVPPVMDGSQATSSLGSESRSQRSLSFSSLAVPSTPISISTSSQAAQKYLSSDTQRLPLDNFESADLSVLEQFGQFFDSERIQDPKTPAINQDSESNSEVTPEREKQDQSKIRRSFHRTLRDVSSSSHGKLRKSKDISPISTVSDQNKDDVLSRGSGSFVVHGKKASVITLSSELKSIAPDERLRVCRPSYKDTSLSSPLSIDDDFHSALTEPHDFKSGFQGQRQNSETTISTITSRSFRDLHRKLLAHVSSDSEGSEATASVSDTGQIPNDLNFGNNILLDEVPHTPQKASTPTSIISRKSDHPSEANMALQPL